MEPDEGLPVSMARMQALWLYRGQAYMTQYEINLSERDLAAEEYCDENHISGLVVDYRRHAVSWGWDASRAALLKASLEFDPHLAREMIRDRMYSQLRRHNYEPNCAEVEIARWQHEQAKVREAMWMQQYQAQGKLAFEANEKLEAKEKELAALRLELKNLFGAMGIIMEPSASPLDQFQAVELWKTYKEKFK